MKHIAVLAYNAQDFFSWVRTILPGSTEVRFGSLEAVLSDETYVYIIDRVRIVGREFDGWCETSRFQERNDAMELRSIVKERVRWRRCVFSTEAEPKPRRYCVISPTAYKRTWFDSYEGAKEHGIALLREDTRNKTDAKLLIVEAQGAIELEKPAVNVRAVRVEDFPIGKERASNKNWSA